MVCSVSTTITIKKTLFRPLEKSVPIPPVSHHSPDFNSLAISMVYLTYEKPTAYYSSRWFLIARCACWKAWNEHIIGASNENLCAFFVLKTVVFSLSLDVAHKIQWIKSYGTWEYESFRCRFLRIKAYQLRNFRLKSYQPRIYWPLTYRLCAFISTKCMRNLWTQPQKPSVNRCQCK